ncbi:MAG TPA: hypothetical protein VF733_02050 [Candidatus Saccharimonadales bacterium]
MGKKDKAKKSNKGESKQEIEPVAGFLSPAELYKSSQKLSDRTKIDRRIAAGALTFAGFMGLLLFARPVPEKGGGLDGLFDRLSWVAGLGGSTLPAGAGVYYATKAGNGRRRASELLDAAKASQEHITRIIEAQSGQALGGLAIEGVSSLDPSTFDLNSSSGQDDVFAKETVITAQVIGAALKLNGVELAALQRVAPTEERSPKT